MSSTTFSRAVEHVQGSLQDPLTPKFCVRYYLYFIHLIHFDQSVNDGPLLPIASEKDSSLYSLPAINLSDVRATHPSVLQAFMIFIRTGRSRGDMRALAQRMESCNCDRTDPLVDEFHCWHWVNHATVPGKYIPEFMPRRDDMESLMAAIGSLLSYTIEISDMDFTCSSPPSGWPLSWKDVLGYDPPRVATQLCRWLDEYPCFQLVHLLASFTDGYAVVSTLLHSATLPRTIVLLLNRALAAMPADFTEHDLGAQVYYRLPLTLMTNFMARTESIVDGVSTAYFYDDQAEPLLDVLTRIGHTTQDTGGFTDITLNMMLSRTGGAVHAKLGLPVDEARYHPDILSGSKHIKEERIADWCAQPWQTTQNILYILTTRPMCVNPPCRNEFDAATWQRCTACRRVLYCSAECQQADWGHHKKICKMLKAVGDAVGFPAATTSAPPVISQDDFRNQCMNAGVYSDALALMLKRVMVDDRIIKILNKEPYSKRYEYRLE
ncbi:hypothetical protein BDZ89DRAFT_1071071 [Hymenopellis radicata]|nr:hypothetical protein BDZ89DRAFT_1071071 [Hymenopellis radicata]